jgi:hypothetical protein
MEFFLWVLEREPSPYVFKLHVQALNKNEIKVPMVKRSVQALIPSVTGKKNVQTPKI